MRPAIALVAALALAACQVGVDGAPCRTLGDAADCPPGQACGNDRRCSARAAGCVSAGTLCEIGWAACTGGAEAKERVERCTGAADPVCGGREIDECTAQGLECGTRGPFPGCECRPAFEGTEVAADPTHGSIADAFPFPTGSASPPACRFRRLGHAIAAAGALGVSAVRAHGEPGAPAVFGDVASGESFPLTIPAGITVRGAAAPAGPSVLRSEGADASKLVALEGELEGFGVEASAATGTGVAVSCGGETPSLADVTVDGGGSLTRGVQIVGACGADLTRVEVSNVAGPALLVAAGEGAPVTVLASTFRASSPGVEMTGGTLTLGAEGDGTSAVQVTENVGDGVVIRGGGTVDVRLLGTLVSANGGTGVVLYLVDVASRLTVRGCDVLANGRTSMRGYGPSPGRPVGGIFVYQPSLATSSFVFEANRVWANGGDQLAFWSPGAWSIAAGSSCGPSSNLFACVAPGAYAVAIGGGGSVDARLTVWPGSFDPEQYVSAGVTGYPDFCNTHPAAPALPACPAP
jgi:hypothetical protein